MPAETLRQKQSRFVKLLAQLICHAYAMGYELTLPDPRLPHKKNSLHYIGLAQDFNLFSSGKYLKSTEAHRPLGEYWESLGGSWGGRFSDADGNHYSLEYNGVK
jgi:hypothetical protein